MASTCISTCIDDARVPVRATYVNLYKWPESDFEFVRSMSSKSRKDGHNSMYGHPRVVDSFSCRQLYLRSYTFSREEDYRDEKTIKCLGKTKKDKRKSAAADGGRRKGKAVSCSALSSIFRRLLACTTKVDVAN
ncbi:hypothetical protein CDL12_20813 [Handroanthus impetiginosus]|uniref:Uncharacterized protein n=1 Tax=Handroanthus impetiginosus TaxID=429701 RepID=A0A2G9GN37_9LAMI|nr:hypothetical protein CDL12_20813 [Handroanthus impetiginosus]